MYPVSMSSDPSEVVVWMIPVHGPNLRDCSQSPNNPT